jgi:ParB family chromosome partitioning protein
VLVREVPDEAAAVMALVENIQREDLNPLEEAQGLQRLISEYRLTHEQAAQAVGRSRSAATNLMRLLSLSTPVQKLLMAGDIEMGHARTLIPLPAAQQILLAHQIVAKRLSDLLSPRSRATWFASRNSWPTSSPQPLRSAFGARARRVSRVKWRLRSGRCKS